MRDGKNAEEWRVTKAEQDENERFSVSPGANLIRNLLKTFPFKTNFDIFLFFF